MGEKLTGDRAKAGASAVGVGVASGGGAAGGAAGGGGLADLVRRIMDASHLSPTLPVGNGIGWLGGRPCPVGFMSGLTRTAGMVVTQAWNTGSLVLSLPIHDVS